MTKPVIIEKDGKPEYAVLPWNDYVRLTAAAEDAADAAALEAFDTADDGERLPDAMVARLLDGDNPVRVWRGHRGMKGKDLAAAAGIQPSYLSQIETGDREGSLAVLRRIAAALGCTLDDLYPA